MKKVMKKVLRISFFLITTISFCVPYAFAQDEGTVQPPDLGISCVTKDKGYTVHFTAYQQVEVEKEEGEEPEIEYQRFCHNLPITGLTFITVDLVDRRTRKQPVAMRIVEAAPGKKKGKLTETRTLVQIPEKHYRAGLVEAQVTFDKRGLYAAILTIGGEEINIPVRVGIEEEASLVRRALPIVLGILLLAALGYAIYRFRISQTAKAKIKEEKKGEEESKEEEDKDKD